MTHPTRPTPLVEVRPQGQVQRHVVEDLGELAPLVRILDLPVPQIVENVSDTLRFLDFPIAEQVIEVPKISCSPCPSRSPIPETQSAEQLVEVPTVCLPPASPCGSRSRSLTLLFLVVVVKVFSQNRVQQRRLLLVNAFLSGLWSRSSTVLLLVLALGRGLPHLLVLQMKILLVFSHFSPCEKVRSAGQVSADLPRLVSSWTPAAYVAPSGSVEWVQFLDVGGLFFWNRRTRETARQPPAGVTVDGGRDDG